MLDDDDGIYGMLTFLLEGVLLLAVALVGLLGNLISFVTIFRQKIQKTFHNLLFLLTVFDMVRVPAFLHPKFNSNVCKGRVQKQKVWKFPYFRLPPP